MVTVSPVVQCPQLKTRQNNFYPRGQWSFYYSPHPMTPFFQNFNIKFQIFRLVLRAIRKCCQFLDKNGKFSLEFDSIYTKLPLFCSFHTKKVRIFWIPHLMTLFFLQNPTPNVPCFRSRLGTYPSLSYLSAPGLFTA